LQVTASNLFHNKYMARQKGIIKLKGKIGDVSFYKSQDGHLAREKGGVDGARIKNDAAFVRTRENNSEFGSSANAGKMIRNALRPMMMTAGDNRVTSRLTKLMTDIKNLDTMSVRGQRTVGTAIGSPNAKAMLKGFNFNDRAILGAILFKPYNVNTLTGAIKITGLIPASDIAFPPGATHMAIKGAWAKIDFANGMADVQQTNIVNIPIDGTANNILLTPVAVPAGGGTDLFLLQIEFYQETNGMLYSLKNGAYNALCIVEVN
jgi:hypothetical protein